jgi:hypothetical protein
LYDTVLHSHLRLKLFSPTDPPECGLIRE